MLEFLQKLPIQELYRGQEMLQEVDTIIQNIE